MRFIVTGGAGFIGSNIVKLLVQNKHEVIVIDNLHTGKKENLESVYEKIQFYNIDIRHKEKLNKIVKNCDGIFHQAALTVVSESFKIPNEYYDVNVIGTKNIFEIAEKEKIKVVFASSSSIYGNVNKIPILENSEKNPINPYGKTKLDDEILAEQFTNKNNKIVGLRYFNVFGFGQTGSYAGVITKFMNALSNVRSPIIFGNGEQIRDFVYVLDIAKANLAVMESNLDSGFLNVGTGKVISIKNLAELMTTIYDLKLIPKYEPSLPGDVKQSQADTSKMNDLIGWKYETELEDGLKQIIKNEI
ncbi:NAD-dependent epimerase/dehydratase family protein [Candidatus Nitrosopelagicus sp.]|nr:NAD-dependent epimerase/dehydratase family protein [Candidatus Nitrosopelagicus sp.]